MDEKQFPKEISKVKTIITKDVQSAEMRQIHLLQMRMKLHKFEKQRENQN